MADPVAAATGAAGSAASGVAGAVKKFTPINWALISNPWNWIIVLLMVLIATFAIDIIMRWYETPDAADAS